VTTRQKLKGMIVAFALLAMAAVVLVSCGGSGETDATSTVAGRPLTKVQFVKKGNQICQRGLEEKEDALLAAGEKLSPAQQEAPSKKTFETLVGAVLPSLNGILSRLGELAPPEGEVDTVEGILARYDAAMEKVESTPQLLVRNEPFAGADSQASGYGLAYCSF
jgi:hypothetical protein